MEGGVGVGVVGGGGVWCTSPFSTTSQCSRADEMHGVWERCPGVIITVKLKFMC